MKASRFLYLAPAFLLAAAFAPACSSSSNNNGDSGAPPGDTGTGSTGTGTGGTGTGTGKGHSSGTGSSTGSSTGSGTGVTTSEGGTDGGGGCAPGALPTGFTPSAHPGSTTACTSTTLAAITTDCFTGATAAEQMTCTADDMMSCEECVITAVNASTPPTIWGGILIFGTFPPSGGSSAVIQYPFGNLGGCVAIADPSAAGVACGKALQEQVECEIAACTTASCTMGGDSTTGQPTGGQDAINAISGTFDSTGTLTTPGCLENADTEICMSYVNTTNTACAAETNEAGTGPIDLCETALDLQTTAGFVAAQGIFCGGGADAGI